jgi:multiple sugar transport system permease protein
MQSSSRSQYLYHKKSIFPLIIEGLILVGAVVALMPVLFIFVTACKPNEEILHFQHILPERWTAANFSEVLGNREEIPIMRWLANSMFVSTTVTLLVLFFSSMAAYALARLKLPGGRWVFSIIIATLMVPGQILLVPLYLILNWLDWLDTHLALIVPAASGAFGVFLLHQFFLSIPRDYEEAAMIDGCTQWDIYWRIILPLSKPALATLGIFTFIGSWNNFMLPLIMLDSLEKYTLPVGIALFQSSYSIEYGITLAACAICTTPVLVVFFLFQRHIIKGMSLSGLKG